jgi:glycosyltransferase involved in cell wall biosynthesis
MKVPGDVVICSSSGWAHGARTTGRKVVYCYSPAKWLYQPDRYQEGGRLGRSVVRALGPPLRAWDGRAARSADRYLAISSVVRDWVREAYGIDADVLPPPWTLDPAGPAEPVEGLEPGYFFCISRLLGYKNVHHVVEAFRSLPGHRLVVAGTGPQAGALADLAGPNVRLLGGVRDDQLRWLYAHASGLVAASFEDFGLTPLEASAFGKPSVVLRWGGFVDTVVEGSTGVFFDRPDAVAIASAVRAASETQWDAGALRSHADAYSAATFAARLRAVVRAEEPAGG